MEEVVSSLFSRQAVLAVIMGIRAGQMDSLGHITLPCGESGEEEVADFILHSVLEYREKQQTRDDLNFDEFIEMALEWRYGNAEDG